MEIFGIKRGFHACARCFKHQEWYLEIAGTFWGTKTQRHRLRKPSTRSSQAQSSRLRWISSSLVPPKSCRFDQLELGKMHTFGSVCLKKIESGVSKPQTPNPHGFSRCIPNFSSQFQFHKRRGPSPISYINKKQVARQVDRSEIRYYMIYPLVI